MNYCYIFGFFQVKNLLHGLFYYLCLPFIYLLAILPFPLLYFFSDGVYVLLYHVLGYRRKIVRENLVKSFPEKQAKEIGEIEKKLLPLFLRSYSWKPLKHLLFQRKT